MRQSRELTQKPQHLAGVMMIFGFDPCDPELYFAHYLRPFDELDPDSAVDGVKDEGGPFAGGVVLLAVLTDCLKRPKKRLFHNGSCLFDLRQAESQVSIA